MFYKLLGWAVWNGGLWYLRRNYGGRMKVGAALLVGAAVLGIAAAGRSSRP
jgi:hypothetical protein